jgi:hypothetical protein
MKAISREDFAEWFKVRGLEFLDSGRPVYRGLAQHGFLIKLPDSPSRILALARCCFPGADYDVSFQGATVWFRDWGIWNEGDEKMGMRVVTRMRAGLGENRELIETPGHIFSEEEFVDARAFWTWPMFLGWDALVFPRKSDYFVFTSHDEFVCVIAKEREVYVELLERFSVWQPQESSWYFR